MKRSRIYGIIYGWIKWCKSFTSLLDLTPDEKVTGKNNIFAFDGHNEKSVMDVLIYFSENYEGEKRTYIDRDGDEIVSSYRLLLVAQRF